jgi:hypothetical protein
MRSNRLAWYRNIKQRDESHITKRVMSMNVDGHPSKGLPKNGMCKGWHDNKKERKKERKKSIERIEEENMLCRPHLVG